jgi:heterotetrameric sarcosine oxidase gamma subunit
VPETPSRRSALSGASASHDLIQERTDLCLHRIYGPIDGIGVELPMQANRTAGSDDWHALWLAPGEWLLDGDVPELAAKMDAGGVAATDLSHARVVFRIPAALARDILVKGCPLDVREEIFPPGHCAQSVMAGVAILIHHLSDGAHMDIYVARSYGRFMQDWLLDAAG